MLKNCGLLLNLISWIDDRKIEARQELKSLQIKKNEVVSYYVASARGVDNMFVTGIRNIVKRTVVFNTVPGHY